MHPLQVEGELGAEDESLSALVAGKGEGPPLTMGSNKVPLKGGPAPEGLFAVGAFSEFADVPRGVEAVEVVA